MASEPTPATNPPGPPTSIPNDTNTTPPDDADQDSTDQRQPKTAEDRKAAAALSSLTATSNDEDAPKAPSAADREALGKAMSRLEAVGAGGAQGTGVKSKGKAEKGEKEREVEAERKREEERKRKVKVDQADVGLLVEELELTKARATDLLKSHDGDAVKAIRAYITSSA